MPLSPQTASIPLYGGLDLKTDAKFVKPGMLLTAENVRWPAVQQAAKRYGQTPLPASLGTGVAAGTYLNELLAFDGTNLQSYAQAQQTWISKGAMDNVQVSVTPSIRSAGSVSGVASVFTDTAQLYAWEDSRGGVWYSVRDAQSGTFLVPSTQLDASGVSPQAFKLGDYVGIAYGVGSQVKLAKLNAFALQGGILSTILLGGDYAGGTIAATASATQGVLGWNSTLAVGEYSFVSLDTSFRLVNFANGLISGGVRLNINLAFDTAGLNVLFSGTNASAGATQAYFTCLDPATLSAGTAATYNVTSSHMVGACSSATNTWTAYIDNNTGAFMPNLQTLTVTGLPAATPTVSLQTTTYGIQLAATPAFLDGSAYAVAISSAQNRNSSTSQQASFFLIRESRIAKRFLGGTAAIGGTVIPQLSVVGSDLEVALAQQIALRADATGTVYAQTGLVVVDLAFPSPSPAKILTLGTSATVTCGNTYAYDGAVLVEEGFWEFPDGITAAPVGSGGALSAGLYTYQVTYEWVDSAGNTHYSAPSFPVQVTTGASDSVTLNIPYTALTLRTDATVNIYRSAHDSIAPLYHVASTPNLQDGTATWTYTDTASDASIAGQRLLYAPADGSGELENDPPPPFKLLTATKTRLFGVAEDDPYALWYSKPLLPGRPAEWSALQVIRIETDGGAVTALGALDAQCVLFKASRVYYLPGDGPNAAGLPTNAFPQTLTLISTTSGCNNPASVLNTHEGVFFQSSVGMQVLTRSLTTDLTFGLPVQPLVQSLNLTGALVVASQNQLRWVSSSGTALVYDYVLQRWSTYTNYDAVGYVLWQNVTPARLRSTGEVYLEDTTVFTDNANPVTMTLETSWLKPAAMAQGYAAVWYGEILGDYISTHKLQVEIAYDYMPVPSQTVVWDPTTNNVTYGTDSPYGSTTYYGTNTKVFTAQYQVRVALARQTCEAVKFKISDTSQLGASCNLNEIALQLGVVGGVNRVPTSQQV